MEDAVPPAVLPDLSRAWDVALRRLEAIEGPVVVLFSGGVDSGFLAWELRHRPATSLATIGAPGSESLQWAETAARRIGLPWSSTAVTVDAVLEIRARLAEWVGGASAVERSVRTALAFAVAHAPPGHLVCGQGVDELFLGYAHFRGLDRDSAIRRADSETAALLAREWPRTFALASHLGRSISAPFLEPEFVRAATRLPAELRVRDHPPKETFRRWAASRGLPAEIADRPKRALQFSSGVDRVLGRG